MKKLIIIITALLSALACTNLDKIQEQLRDHEQRIQKLEALCTQLNSNVEAIQTILTALEQNDYITDITKITEAGIEIGYSITFAKGGTVNIYHGSNGTDAPAPKIGIRKASDGEYYWTSNDEWLTDESGEKIPASVPNDPDGKYITPSFRIAEGVWYISFDDGASWREFDGILNDMIPEPLIKSVEDAEDHFTISLSDGTEIIIPKFRKDDAKKDMACIINGNDIYVRAKGFAPENDMVWKLNKIGSGGNKYFNIHTMYTCPDVTDNSNLSKSLVSWKGSSDDLCPTLINGSHIGGNHGCSCVDRIKCTGHGKTDADIGSVWTDSTGKTYVLTHIYNKNELGLVMFNEKNMSNGIMGLGKPKIGTEISHQSGATNTDSILIEELTSTQLWQCFNNYSISLSIDGNEVDINTNAVHIGDQVSITTQYDIIYVPAMLTYLMENVGNNDKDSQHSEDIKDYYLRLYITFQFNRNGSMSKYTSYYINKDVTLSYIGLVQSMRISAEPYMYTPDTIYDDIIKQDQTITYHLTNDKWRDAGKVPYRYYQFADDTCAKGMCLVYDRSIGLGQNDLRLAHCDHAGRYRIDTGKMYPYLINGGSLAKGTYLDAMAARVPLYKYDEDLTAVGWYWCDKDIILMVDTHKPVDKEITLPEYMNDMRVEILDKTESVACNQTYLFNRKVRFTSDGYGYLVLRLYK